ncbi:MAG: hypothetical protein R2733_20070 [Acidimicrobiales bacterium]
MAVPVYAESMIDEAVSRPASPMIEARVLNAIRIRESRVALVATGAFTVAELARGRGTSAAAVHAWLRRAVERHRLLSINNGGEVLVPAVLLDEALDPVPEWQPVLEVLAATGLDDWQQWSWIMSPCSWLSDQVPAVVMAVNPERVLAAAVDQAEAANDR